MHTPPHQAGLVSLALLATATDLQVVEEILGSSGLHALYDLAVQHGMACQIHHHLALLRPRPHTAEASVFRDSLADYSQHYALALGFVDHEAISLLQKLARQGVTAIVLKGFALAYQVYEKPALRPRTDIDILIDAAHKEAVKETFLSSGYWNPRGWEPVAISNQLSYRKQLGKGLNVNFDVHLKISNNKLIENIIKHQELLLASNRHAIADVQLISKPYALIHAASHLLNHQAAGDLVKLIWHYDIHLLVESLTELERAQLLMLCSEKGMAEVMRHTLGLTAQYFPSSRFGALIAALENSRSDSAYACLLSNTSGMKAFMMNLKLTGGISNKLDVVRETVFPPAQEIYAKYGAESAWPLWLLYLRRIVGGIIKYSSRRQSENG